MSAELKSIKPWKESFTLSEMMEMLTGKDKHGLAAFLTLLDKTRQEQREEITRLTGHVAQLKDSVETIDRVFVIFNGGELHPIRIQPSIPPVMLPTPMALPAQAQAEPETVARHFQHYHTKPRNTTFTHWRVKGQTKWLRVFQDKDHPAQDFYYTLQDGYRQLKIIFNTPNQHQRTPTVCCTDPLQVRALGWAITLAPKHLVPNRDKLRPESGRYCLEHCPFEIEYQQ